MVNDHIHNKESDLESGRAECHKRGRPTGNRNVTLTETNDVSLMERYDTLLQLKVTVVANDSSVCAGVQEEQYAYAID